MNDFLQNLRNTHLEDQRAQTKSRKNFDHSHQHSTNSRFHSQGSFSRPSQPQQHPKRVPCGQPQTGNGSNVAQNKAPNSNPAGIVESALLADAIENLSSHLETLVKTQEYTAVIQEKVATALDNQTRVFEKMLDVFQECMGESASGNNYSRGQKGGGNSRLSSVEEASVKDEESDDQDQNRAQFFSGKSRTLLRKRPQTAGFVSSRTAHGELSGNGRFTGQMDTIQTDSGKFTSMEKSSNALKSRKEIMDIIYSMRDEGATFDQVAKYLSDLGQPTFSGRGEWHAQTVHRLCNR